MIKQILNESADGLRRMTFVIALKCLSVIFVIGSVIGFAVSFLAGIDTFIIGFLGAGIGISIVILLAVYRSVKRIPL